MSAVTFREGERVRVYVFDEATGGERWPGTVRRMGGDDSVKVRLDAGFDVAAHARDVEPIEADDSDRRAA